MTESRRFVPVSVHLPWVSKKRIFIFIFFVQGIFFYQIKISDKKKEAKKRASDFLARNAHGGWSLPAELGRGGTHVPEGAREPGEDAGLGPRTGPGPRPSVSIAVLPQHLCGWRRFPETRRSVCPWQVPLLVGRRRSSARGPSGLQILPFPGQQNPRHITVELSA